jgi:hypothetical protein
MKISPNVFVIIIALIQTSVSLAQQPNEMKPASPATEMTNSDSTQNETVNPAQKSNEIKPASPATEMTNSGFTQKEFNQASIRSRIDEIRKNLPTIDGTAKKFEYLRNHRKNTLDDISNVSNGLSSVDTQVISLQSLVDLNAHNQERSLEEITNLLTRDKADRDQAQIHLNTLKDSKQTPDNEINKAVEALAQFNKYVSYDESELNRAKIAENLQSNRKIELSKLRENRESLSSSILSYQRLLGSIDDMVNQLFIASDATNVFKLNMSIAFSILVGIVIIGFFGIAWSNDEIKKLIIANEAGIQFVTVFSIVIAIILFGIIGVLEGKELSALLGGLSGYILGKSK